VVLQDWKYYQSRAALTYSSRNSWRRISCENSSSPNTTNIRNKLNLKMLTLLHWLCTVVPVLFVSFKWILHRPGFLTALMLEYFFLTLTCKFLYLKKTGLLNIYANINRSCFKLKCSHCSTERQLDDKDQRPVRKIISKRNLEETQTQETKHKKKKWTLWRAELSKSEYDK